MEQIFHNKRKCLNCIYHDYLGNVSSTYSEKQKANICICAYILQGGHSCLYDDEHGKLQDIRGDDPNHCKLFKPGERIAKQARNFN